MLTDYELLMKLLGIEKETVIGCYDVYREQGIDIFDVFCRDYLRTCGQCEKCPHAEYVAEYPQFYPYKQLELIKLLPGFRCFKQDSVWIMDYTDTHINLNIRVYGSEGFEETLCKLIINAIERKVIDKEQIANVLRKYKEED